MHQLHHHQHGDGTQQYNKDGQAGEDPGSRFLEGEVGESGRRGHERGNRQHDFQVAFHFELQRKIGPTREFEPAASAKKGEKRIACAVRAVTSTYRRQVNSAVVDAGRPVLAIGEKKDGRN
ncbi:MAG: hypothetical protein Q8S92_14925 [Hydrogenophaga sp.]|uniref:hypothetical protein n=1 Tax=Hydrogenophaga sp. TaxID=1904254 RepID=UPI0027370C7B|nr:hypothetical protein [Hydrogenophaga sp.]MDP3350281.1 hypothetical protein [Hydrogenophaga sp.]